MTNADEMAELAPLASAASETAIPVGAAELPGLSADHLRVRDALSARSARVVDDIAARSGLSIASVQSVLGAMQLEGAAAERPSGWVRTGGRPVA